MCLLTFDEYLNKYSFMFGFSLSNEEAVTMKQDEGNESETEVSDIKVSEISSGSLDNKSLQHLTVIKTDSPLVDTDSEGCD